MFDEFLDQEEKSKEGPVEFEEEFDDDLIDEMSQSHLIQEPKKTLDSHLILSGNQVDREIQCNLLLDQTSQIESQNQFITQLFDDVDKQI